MSHGATPDPGDLAVPELARVLSEQMQALATPSRLRILGALHGAPQTVGSLATAVEMEPSAVSHQLRVLRHQGFVVGDRDGRNVVYRLHDEHVGKLLTEAIAHLDHLRLGLRSEAVQPAEAGA
jgi:ArsR family transcriptional regulator, nickel/cobalt-responsive transcriptional repressor